MSRRERGVESNELEGKVFRPSTWQGLEFPSGPALTRSVSSVCAVAWLGLAACTGPGAAEQHEQDRAPVFASVSGLTRLQGKPADQEFELAGGHQLLLWNYAMSFSELEPGQFSYVAIACEGEVLGFEKMFPGARLPGTEDGYVTVSDEDMAILRDVAASTDQKLAVLRRMSFASPWTSGHPSQQ
jgi:hypothetical protein